VDHITGWMGIPTGINHWTNILRSTGGTPLLPGPAAAPNTPTRDFLALGIAPLSTTLILA